MSSHLMHSPLLRLRFSQMSGRLRPRYASNSAPITNKSQILEKPTRFNPPSHGARRVQRKIYPGPRLSEAEAIQQKTRKYPNMMPPEGSFMHNFLTDRRLHVWISLSTLTFLAMYTFTMSFLHTTIYRSQLPSSSDFMSHPFTSLGKFFTVYKLHVAHESEKVADKRRKKLEDAQKRKEFLKEHGVEPGFLTGTWMDKFGTVEGDAAKAKREGLEAEQAQAKLDAQSPVAAQTLPQTHLVDGAVGRPVMGEGEELPRRERKKVKMWFGIW